MSKRVKVIFTEEIGSFKKWDIKEIPFGFFRNHPSIKEKVWLYNKENCQAMEKVKEQEKAAVLLKEAENKKIHQAINNQQFFFTLKKGENNQIFGSVRAEDILTEIKKLGFQLEKKQLLDFSPLNSSGDSLVKIRLSENLLAQIKITITVKK